MSPGCECVTKTGAEVASRGEERAGRAVMRVGDGEPKVGKTHKDSRHWGRARGTFLWEKRPRSRTLLDPGQTQPCAAETSGAERRFLEKDTAGWMG